MAALSVPLAALTAPTTLSEPASISVNPCVPLKLMFPSAAMLLLFTNNKLPPMVPAPLVSVATFNVPPPPQMPPACQ